MLKVAANILYTAGLLAKFRGKHVGPVLCYVASTRTTRRSLILLHALSLAHARGGSVDEDMILLTTTSYASCTRWTNMQHLIRYCRSSNIIVRLLEEAKSQVQPEHGSCKRSRGSLCVE